MKRVNKSDYSSKVDFVFHYIALFFIYGLMGFLIETLYRNVIFDNSGMVGFLSFTPVLPIYGFMGMLTYLFIKPMENLIEKFSKNRNEMLISIGIYLAFFTIIPAILELIGGITLKHVFNTKEWDYTDKPLNYKGYISLVNIAIFGVLGVFNMLVIFYWLDSILVKYLNKRIIRIVLIILVTLLIIDIVYTVTNRLF